LRPFSRGRQVRKREGNEERADSDLHGLPASVIICKPPAAASSLPSCGLALDMVASTVA
jgi:hypothetical protein